MRVEPQRSSNETQRASERQETKMSEGEDATMPTECGALYRALCECHRRVREPWQREISCRHLNRSLAQCVVSVVCPDESEAVRTLCASAGTSMKRTQCQRAKLALSVCISSHQAPDAP